MNIEVKIVAAGDARLDRLLQLYIHEWCDRVPSPIGEDARFTYRDLPAYEDSTNHVACLFMDGPIPIGFALAARDEKDTWHMKEMFVIAGSRGRGVGATCARRLFAIRPGSWTLTVRPENPGALRFWRNLTPEAVEAVEVGDDQVVRTRLSFTTSSSP